MHNFTVKHLADFPVPRKAVIIFWSGRRNGYFFLIRKRSTLLEYKHLLVQNHGKTRRSRLVYQLLLIAIPFIVYNDTVNFSFVNWDDDINVFENPYITDSSFESIRKFWSAPYADLYIPVTYSLWMITGFAGSLLSGGGEGQLSPVFFHGLNLAIHIFNGLLVFSILYTLSSFSKEEGKQSFNPAFFGALFFILHPVQSEPVCWVTGLKDLLSGFFSFLSLLAYLKLRQSDFRERYCLRFMPFVCFLLALLSKPSAVTLPLSILVIECFFFQEKKLRTLLRLSPWFFFSLITVLVSQLSQSNKISSVFNIWKQIVAGLGASGFYISKLFFPFNLSADYGFSIENVFKHTDFRMFWILPFFLLAPFFVHRRALVTPVLLFFVFLLPVLGFIPFAFQSLSIVADRYMYMAVFGASMGITLLLKQLPVRVAVLPISFTLICFALSSAHSSEKWKTPFELFTRTIMTNPKSYISYNNLGVRALKRGDHRTAEHYFREALRVKPDFFLSNFNLANSLTITNQLENAEAHFKKALETNIEHLLANYNLGIVYARRDMNTDAIRQFKEVVSIDNTYTPAYLDLGKLMAAQGKYGEAATMYKRALEFDIKLSEACVELSELYFHLGDYKQSLFFGEKALVLDPGNLKLKQILKNLNTPSKGRNQPSIKSSPL